MSILSHERTTISLKWGVKDHFPHNKSQIISVKSIITFQISPCQSILPRKYRIINKFKLVQSSLKTAKITGMMKINITEAIHPKTNTKILIWIMLSFRIIQDYTVIVARSYYQIILQLFRQSRDSKGRPDLQILIMILQIVRGTGTKLLIKLKCSANIKPRINIIQTMRMYHQIFKWRRNCLHRRWQTQLNYLNKKKQMHIAKYWINR